MKDVSQLKVAITPEKAGYHSERLKVLDEFLWNLIDEKKIQCGSYAMARNGNLFVCRGMGKLHYNENDTRSCQHDSIRRIASVTKMFTAVAIMKLVEDGILETTTPVAMYLKEFDNKAFKEITITHLLSHTSGLRFDGLNDDDPYPMNWWDIIGQNDVKYNWIEAILSMSPDHKLGEKWAYCSAGYMILGEIITRVTGIKAEDFIVNSIIKPLGMEDTYFELPKEKWDRAIVTDECSDPYKREENHKKHLEELEKSGRKEIDLPNTAGGIYSTPYDLVIFGKMLLNNGTYNGIRILYRKTVEMMRRDCANGAKDYCWGAKGSPKFYGLGPQLYGQNKQDLLSPSTYGHEGAGRSAIYIDPDEQFVAVNFVPTTEAWVPKTVLNLRNVMWSGLM